MSIVLCLSVALPELPISSSLVELILLKKSCNPNKAITYGATIHAVDLSEVGNEKVLISRYTTHLCHPFLYILKKYPNHMMLIFSVA